MYKRKLRFVYKWSSQTVGVAVMAGYITRLTGAGALVQRNIGKERYRVFEAPDVIRLIAALNDAPTIPVPEQHTLSKPLPGGRRSIRLRNVMWAAGRPEGFSRGAVSLSRQNPETFYECAGCVWGQDQGPRAVTGATATPSGLV